MFQTVLLVALLCCVSATIDHSQCRLDLVLCLDNTGSIAVNPDGSKDTDNPPRNWELVVDFAQDLVRELTVSPSFSQVGLVDFGGKARIQFDLDDYPTQSEVIDAIAPLPFIGDTTNTSVALSTSRAVLTDPQYGGRTGVPKVVILVTDGKPYVRATENEADVVAKVLVEAQKLRDAGVRTIVVGITQDAEEELMKKIAYSESDYVYAPDFSDLDSITKLVLNDNTCQIVTTTKAPPPTTTTEPPPTTTKAPPTTTTAPAPTEPIVYC